MRMLLKNQEEDMFPMDMKGFVSIELNVRSF